MERRHRFIRKLSRCFVDMRNQGFVEHRPEELLAQRIFGIALGYEDINDHDRLRLDPAHALLAGKTDITGEKRVREADRGKALAAHATLNRLELGACGGDGRHIKILAQANRIESLLISESSEIRSSADISERSRKFVRIADQCRTAHTG